MRYVFGALGLTAVLIAGGCTNGRMNFIKGPDPQPLAQDMPTAAQLIGYMDNNAQRVTSLYCEDVDLTVSAPGQPTGTVQAKVACQRGRRFRMVGDLLGKRQVDLGSNGQEFWYWLRASEEPKQFYCSYEALASGRLKYLPPFPFQPDWVLETLGMGNYGPPENYQVVPEGDKIKLVESARGPQGNPVKKVIVFQRRPARGAPVITDYLLLDAGGKEICSAHIQEVQTDQGGGSVPRRLELRWPDQKIRLTMRMTRQKINTPLNEAIFARPRDPGITSVDLATGQPDPTGTALRRVGGQ